VNKIASASHLLRFLVNGRWRKGFYKLAGYGIAGVLGALIVTWLFHFFVLDNLMTVEKGLLYRSGQMSDETLQATAARLHLASIVNLRGANPDAAWYQSEIKMAESLHLHHYDIRMGSRSFPSPEALQQLTDVFEKGPYPMLLHCYRGADRSGLASAIYLIECRGETSKEAAGQLSLWYGHIPLFGYERMNQFLKFYHNNRQEANIAEWSDTDYPRLFASRNQSFVLEHFNP